MGCNGPPYARATGARSRRGIQLVRIVGSIVQPAPELAPFAFDRLPLVLDAPVQVVAGSRELPAVRPVTPFVVTWAGRSCRPVAAGACTGVARGLHHTTASSGFSVLKTPAVMLERPRMMLERSSVPMTTWCANGQQRASCRARGAEGGRRCAWHDSRNGPLGTGLPPESRAWDSGGRFTASRLPAWRRLRGNSAPPRGRTAVPPAPSPASSPASWPRTASGTSRGRRW